ncbi:MAG: L-serine ammonia-lyase, iron-sulfur-dependent, subunit alpha [bacterium]
MDSLSAVSDLKANNPNVSVSQNEEQTIFLAQINNVKSFSQSDIEELIKDEAVLQHYLIQPVMPVVMNNSPALPFETIQESLAFASQQNLDMGACGLIYESGLTGIGNASLSRKMDHLISIMEHSIETGKQGTEWEDRILHRQSHLIREAEQKGRIIPDNLINEIITNVTAIMEAKSAMEVVVANPTAGSCGTVAGVIQAVAGKCKVSREELIKAYFAAGMAGVFFAEGPGFAAEEHGCQVECGASAGMAAAAIVQLCGGSAAASLGAASLAIQNMIGLICDPIADRVEAPCLGKNVSAAVNAYASATMVLAGYDTLIPYDQVLETVKRVGNLMPACHKCTGEGGLAITPAAKLLKKQLENLKTR